MSLLFNMLSRVIITFLPRIKHLLILWLQSTVILEPKEIKSVIVSIVSPSICHEVMGQDAMMLVFLMFNFKPGFSLLLSPILLYHCTKCSTLHRTGLSQWLSGKESTCNARNVAGTAGSIPGSGKSSDEENSNPLQ